MDMRERILQFTTKPVPHEIAELGTVYLRRMTLGELDQVQKANAATPKAGDIPIPTTVRILARFLGDEAGAPLYDLDKPVDRDALLAFPVGLAAEIIRAGNKINNMEEPKDDAAKN